LDVTSQSDRDAARRRLNRGAVVLLVIFWVIHFTVMWLRSQIDHDTGEWVFDGDRTLRRFLLALFGAFLGYLLYLVLRLVRQRGFGRQAAIGGALALVAASIQGAVNGVVFSSGVTHYLPTFVYNLLYWFWFYFSWTTAYLALTYSISMQEQQRYAAELTVKAQEAQVRALRYQINPHFLFNTLNAISALVRDAPERAEEMLVQLSDFFRRSLSLNPMEDVSLAQEVDLQRLYLEIERTRFPDRLRFDVALGEGSAEARVPPLLLQPLVENAVKHGVARSEAPVSIRIRARIDGELLEIVVENDATVASPCPSGEKVGLHNVAERLRSRFGDEAGLVSAPAPEGGFRNTIRIPLRR